MIDSIVIEGFILLYMGSSIYLFFKEIDKEKHKEAFQKHMNKIYGGKIMFDKMKIVKFNQIRSYMVKGIPVYMVMLDNTIVEVTEATDIELLFFHYLKNGAFAVPRKKRNGLGDFTKHFNVGQWSFEVSHKRKDGDA